MQSNNVQITGGYVGTSDAGVSLNGTDAGVFRAQMTKIEGLSGFAEYTATLVSNSATLSVTGLNGDVDGDYRVECNIVSNAGTNGIQFEINGAATNMSSLSADRLSGSVTNASWTIASASFNPWPFAANDVGSVRGMLYAKSGRNRAGQIAIRLTGSQNDGFDIYGTFADTASNITSFQAVASQANGIKSGSYCRLTAMQSNF